MAHVRRLQARRWQARYRDPAGRERARNFSRKADAEKWLTTVEAAKLRGEWVDPVLARMSVGVWALEVEASRPNRRPTTMARDEASLRNHILPAFGDVELRGVQPLDVQQWVAHLEGKGLAPATIHKAYQILARVFEAAVVDGRLTRSPCRGVKLPKVEASEMRFLSPDEVATLADVIDPRYRAMVLTAAYGGLRFGELAALRADRFNELRRTLVVEETLVEVNGRFTFGPPKSKASRRTVMLPAGLVEVIGDHIAVHADPSGLMFSAPAGGPIRRTHFRQRVWQPAVRASAGEPCRFHDLRHSHAALLIAQGTHPKVIQERLGHASIKTTLDVYGHLYEGLDEAAADALDEAFRRAAADSVRILDGLQVAALRP